LAGGDPTADSAAASNKPGSQPPRNEKADRLKPPVPANSKITLLIKAALSKHKLAQMPPSWQPWL